MKNTEQKKASTLLVLVAFAIVYLVWGSTYFFIRLAIQNIPALLMAAMRFFSAGLLLLIWCVSRGQQVFVWKNIRSSMISGLLLLFFGNGAVVWGEQFLPSSFVAVLTAASPIWIVLLDKRHWSQNFRNRETVIGLITGFLGVLLLFSEHVSKAFHSQGDGAQLGAMGILVVGAACWAGGSLYSKYHSKEISHSVSTGWQMLTGGMAFIVVSGISGEWKDFHAQGVSTDSWLALLYLRFPGRVQRIYLAVASKTSNPGEHTRLCKSSSRCITRNFPGR
jgi:drug/metabolite transporter (DMT)-like permease